MRAAVAAFIVIGLALPARGGTDYDANSRAWNGLSELRALATSAGLTVEAVNDASWESLSPDKDVLFLLYPTREVDAVQLIAFIRAGGRVLLADDFGKADEALARLSLIHGKTATVRAQRHDGNPNLPIAKPRDPSHPLARDVTELVTNHPSVLTATAGDTVFSFSGGDAVVVTGEIGTGRYVVLSDPSVLINAMLAFDGNLAFALNLLRYLSPKDGPMRVVLCTGDFVLHGEPTRLPEASSVNDLLAGVGATLDDLNDYVPSEALLRALGATGAAAFLILLVWVAARARAPKQDASFARAGEPEALPDWDTPATRNFALPAVVLRENLEGRVDPSGLADLPTRAELATAFVSRRAFIDAFDRLHKHGN
jgi:hypothetical protein